jgi:glycosyltransferase involved in cell wall biosynthesis
MRSRFAFTALFDGVIVNAASIVQTLAKTPGFDASLCRVIHNGIEVPALKPGVRDRIRKELGIGAAQFLIGCAGRCTPQKGFDRAIGAFAALAADAPEARLCIAGDGPQIDEYNALARSLNVAEKTIFTGFRGDLAGLLAALDLFWLTSRSEGMPNVLLEAFATGIPAIAFDVAGVRELIDNGRDGLVVAQGDMHALADATRQLMRDDDRRKAMAMAGREKVREKFSMDKMVGAVEQYLSEIIASRQNK